jgi:GrpB-like predicted nucleotidyltransferase (UPF0157 family)
LVLQTFAVVSHASSSSGSISKSLWVERLAFRDYLRTHAEALLEYAELKYRLARQHRFGRESYTEAKTSFVARIAKLALEEKP